MSELMRGEWLLAAAVRSTIVLLVVSLLAFALRRSSAALLYRIWFLGQMSCLVLLAVGSVLPQWKLEVLPAKAIVQVDNSMAKPVFANIAKLPYRPVMEVPQLQTEVDEAVVQVAPIVHAVETGEVAENAKVPEVKEKLTSQAMVTTDVVAGALPSRSVPLSNVVMAGWCCGVVLFVSRYLWRWSAARALRQECHECEDTQWRQVADQCIQALRIDWPVRLEMHPSAISPMVVGILKPAVLLPESSKDWDANRRKLVLMHELSHIQRHDLLMQLLASIACAIYWFNPLAWIAARQMKKLREIACDDAVVSQTAEPELYAEVLLNIALSQRLRPLAGAITMARTSNVKDRITCILDSARRRNPLKRRWAIGLAMFAIAISVLIGTASLGSRAQEIKSQHANTEESKKDELTPDQQLKEFMKDPTTFDKMKMVIKVFDENGKPMPDALVHVTALDFFDKELSAYRTPDSRTDTNGKAVITYTDPGPMKELTPFPSMWYFPQIMEKLKISVAKVGYVAMVIEFDTIFLPEDEVLPASYEIRLHKAQRLAGYIIDSEGKPVVGAKIQLDVDRNYDLGSDPTLSFEPLAVDTNAAVSDEKGAWKIDDAPSPMDYKGDFRIKVNHPDYAGDKDWGELQKDQGITTQQLRSGNAVIKLKKGVRLAGLVTDVQGKPITNGMIAWVPPSNLPWEPMKENKAELLPIDAAGRYETGILRSTKYRVAVSAPGYAPQQREIDLQQDMQQANFTLQSGRRIKFRVVDSSGKQIPNATANVGAWRGFFCIYGVEKLNKDQSGKFHGSMINIQPDEYGVFVWDSAPEGKIQFFADADGYVSSKPLLAPGDEIQEIRLTRMPFIFGKVTDKATGQPIKQFQIMPQRNGATESWPFPGPDHVRSPTGDYRYGPEGDWQIGAIFRVRIDADGYRTALGTKDVGIDDGPVHEDFELEHVAATQVTVEDASGNKLQKYSADAYTNLGIQQILYVREDGKMSLDPSPEPILLRVSAKEGYRELVWMPGEDLSTIRLQPWAAVHGRLTQSGMPAAGERVRFMRFQNGPVTIRQDNVYAITVIQGDKYSVEQLTTRTDEEGSFQLDRLPPVAGRLCVDFNLFDNTKIDSSESVPLNLKPGTKTQVNLGSGGAALSGHVVASGRRDEAGTNLWSLNYLVRRDWQAEGSDNATIAFNPNPKEPMTFDWLKKTGFLQWNHFTDLTEFQHWFYRQPFYQFKLDNEGNFKIHGVDPGQYEMLIHLYDKPADGLVETVGQKIVPITITQAQADAGNVSIGNIEIACRQGPRVGADMRKLQYQDSSGTRRNLIDKQDGYVLVHVWAGWSEHCVEELSSLAVLTKDYANDPISFVGFNIDKDPTSAKALAEKLKVYWPQNYVGDNSDLMRQLSISTLPAYYLVGLDGKLIASTELKSTLREMLKKQLRQ